MANNRQYIANSDESSSEEMEVTIYNLRSRHAKICDPGFCLPVEIPDNVRAYVKNIKLEREVEEIECNKDVLENVFSNYVIIKNIMSQLPWQDKLVCEKVSPLWYSAIQTLRREQMEPVDFSVKMNHDHKLSIVEFKQSGTFCNVPMVVFIFYNNACDDYTNVSCQMISPSPCSPPCQHHHSILDFVYKRSAAPNAPLFGSKSLNIAYLPLKMTPTYDNSIMRLLKSYQVCYSGIYIPAMPGVEFLTVSMDGFSDKETVMNELTEITKQYVIKGLIVHLTDNYTLYTNQQEDVVVSCLDHLGTLQPNTPFALGGCHVEDSVTKESEINKFITCINSRTNFISGNQMTLGIFAIPIDIPEKPSFGMFSCVLDSLEWNKENIIAALEEFSQNVPHYEHSIALKLSCTGRHQKHELEQSYFRTLFPKTRIIGCFGNGELGVNFPARGVKTDGEPKKRPRINIQYEKVHSYSTVFVYIGWGKVLVHPATPPNSTN